MTAVFSVWGGDESSYFVTKGEAVAFAKKIAAEPDADDVIEVARCEIGLSGRELLCAALNGTGWVSGRTVVARVPRKGAKRE